ncbi:MAG: hypothetical protein ACPG3W_11200 [Synechococcus sp.]
MNTSPTQGPDIRGFFTSERSLREVGKSIWKVQTLTAEITYAGRA